VNFLPLLLPLINYQRSGDKTGQGVLQCGCRNLRLLNTAPCPLPHAIEPYSLLSMSENIYGPLK
ncbi:MAG: hypothetical protein KDI38_25470, partial [Calditrichaeota bacterium]|nr:hypothetical protein [Calditrichota bacterium]